MRDDHESHLHSQERCMRIRPVINLLADPLYAVLIGSLIGGVFTWVVAWIYYKRAGDELKAEAAALHRAASAIVYFLEHPDANIEVQRDSQGRITGLIVGMTPHGTIASSGRANPGRCTEAFGTWTYFTRALTCTVGTGQIASPRP
jgi:hypothetical protein